MLLGDLLTRNIDAKTILSLCFAFAFIPFTSGLGATLFQEHGIFLTATTVLPMAFLCLVALLCLLSPFISWNRREVALLAITFLFVTEQILAVGLNNIDVKGYQYPPLLGVSMVAGVVGERLSRRIRLDHSASFVRKLVGFLLAFLCVEVVVRFVYSPYVQPIIAPEDARLIYRFKYSFFFMEANYVSMALLCLLAIMMRYRDFFRRRDFFLAYLLLAFTFSRAALIPALAQFIIFRWWRHRRFLTVLILIATILGNVLAFTLYMKTPDMFQDPSFISKLYSFALAFEFMQDAGVSQKLLGMGVGNSNYILGTPVHSIPATFMFEFGVLGTILFVAYLAIMARRSPSCLYFLFVPFAIYGISIIGMVTSSFLFTLGMLSAERNDGTALANASVQAAQLTTRHAWEVS